MLERAARDDGTGTAFLDDGTGWSAMMEKHITLIKELMQD
jgi:metallo-beta-lactamase class B